MFESTLALSLEDAKSKIEEWRKDYNQVRPYSSLGKKSENNFLENWTSYR